jgi:hypothetical protein
MDITVLPDHPFRKEHHGLDPENRWFDTDYSRFIRTQNIREDLPKGVLFDGFPDALSSEHPLGFVMIHNVPSSEFLMPITNRETTVRPFGTMAHIAFGVSPDYVIYVKKRTSWKWNWSEKLQDVLVGLEVDADPCPLLLLVLSDQIVYRFPTISDERYIDVIKRTTNYWRGQELFFRLLVTLSKRVIATRKVPTSITLFTDYGATGSLADILEVIRYYSPEAYAKMCPPCKTSTEMRFGSDPDVFIRE